MTEKTSHRRWTGYVAGIAAGIAYGMNPLFGKPLMESGVPILVMLFYRYLISAILLGFWMLRRKESFKVEGRELWLLVILGLLFAGSSITLFFSYYYIPSGLATTLIYLYPVFVALTMVFLRVYPSWQTWVSILATVLGVILLSVPSGGMQLRLAGIALATGSALCYTYYLVIINRSRRIRHVSEHKITFYSLMVGAILFSGISLLQGVNLLEGISGPADWSLLLGLAIFPTMISMLGIAISTRYIGPVKTSVLGVFEPLTAIFTGVLLFRESITLQMAAGILICIAAVLFLILKPGKAS
ncbi:MAG: DMT family transporter [Bacteroidales bacterium]|nr:DMT family transporter [Bacteroidales bacterium]